MRISGLIISTDCAMGHLIASLARPGVKRGLSVQLPSATEYPTVPIAEKHHSDSNLALDETTYRLRPLPDLASFGVRCGLCHGRTL